VTPFPPRDEGRRGRLMYVRRDSAHNTRKEEDPIVTQKSPRAERRRRLPQAASVRTHYDHPARYLAASAAARRRNHPHPSRSPQDSHCVPY